MLVQIRLTDPDTDRSAAVDPLTQRATAEELELLRATVGLTPHPVWVQNAAQEVIWCNGSYLGLAVHGGEDEIVRRGRIVRRAFRKRGVDLRVGEIDSAKPPRQINVTDRV